MSFGIPLLGILLILSSYERHVFPSDVLVKSLAISHDGTLIATSGSKRENKGPDCVRVWDIATGKLQRTSSEAIFAVSWPMAFAKDGKRVVSYRVTEKDGGLHKQLYSLDWSTGQEEILFNADGYGGCLAFLPDALIVLFGAPGKDPTVHMRDLKIGTKTDLKGHRLRCQKATLSADGKTVATYDGAAVKVWDLPSGKERFHVHDGLLPEDYDSLSLSPDGKFLAYCDRGPMLWDVRPGQKEAKQLKAPAWEARQRTPLYYGASDMHFSPDGRY